MHPILDPIDYVSFGSGASYSSRTTFKTDPSHVFLLWWPTNYAALKSKETSRTQGWREQNRLGQTALSNMASVAFYFGLFFATIQIITLWSPLEILPCYPYACDSSYCNFYPRQAQNRDQVYWPPHESGICLKIAEYSAAGIQTKNTFRCKQY